MATMTNNDRIARAMELLKNGVAPYVERELKSSFGEGWLNQIAPHLRDRAPDWDTSAALNVVAHTKLLADKLGKNGRSYANELIETRNKWAHQEPFSTDDTERALDTARRLLDALGDAGGAAELAEMKGDLQRSALAQKLQNEKRNSEYKKIDGVIVSGLKPWREVITPHADVLGERFNDAEFAADLWQVAFGDGQRVSAEYKNPVEFFRRTYLTQSLGALLSGALLRLSGRGGDPVVQLQTNFGGGKTHSMLALWHLFAGVPLKDLPGLDELAAGAGAAPLAVRRAALVGTKISASGLDAKHDGTKIRTLWGELAWQLGGREAYELVRADDENATNPGSRLDTLLKKYGPALILIDEWVAYARELPDGKDLPGGDFETQFTFAQALTEAVSTAGNALLVVSLPASDAAGQGDELEVGGQRGRTALERLNNVVKRKASSWTPATEDESFMIVRRRLFEPLSGDENFTAHGMTAKAFAELYRSQRSEFPPECADADYERRLLEAYPVHPEVFKRLYEDWGAMAQFQRTRGVLRLMAGVIRQLWKNEDKNALILPAHLPVAQLIGEFKRYLSSPWTAIVSGEVDGTDSLPARLDAASPNLGKYSACRRVTRTLFLGSAPKSRLHQGLEDKRVKLGCVMPGENGAVFGDALRRLAGEAAYLHQDGARSWFDTAPTLNRLAADRAEQCKHRTDEVDDEIRRRVGADVRRGRGEFEKIHEFPASSGEVPEAAETRLVLLPLAAVHARGKNTPASAAQTAAAEILNKRGTAPRQAVNTLVFLAADGQRLEEVRDAVRWFLAWQSIIGDTVPLNLPPNQKKEAETQLGKAEQALQPKIEEAFCWLLAPRQDTPSAAVTWEEWRLSAADGLAIRAWKKLREADAVNPKLGATALRRELDKVPLWNKEQSHVEIKKLAAHFANYLYLPRLKNTAVLADAIETGITSTVWEAETFAYAENFDAEKNRYLGLTHGKMISLPTDGGDGLLVKSDAATRQIAAAAAVAPGHVKEDGVTVSGTNSATTPPPTVSGAPQPVAERQPVRFFGNTELDALTAKSCFNQLADEVIKHFTAKPGVTLTIRIDIAAENPSGFDPVTVRTVRENCATLKFKQHEFTQD